MRVTKKLGRAVINTTYGKINMPLFEVDTVIGSSCDLVVNEGDNFYGDYFASYIDPNSPRWSDTNNGMDGTICDIIGAQRHYVLLLNNINADTKQIIGGDNLTFSLTFTRGFYYYFGFLVKLKKGNWERLAFLQSNDYSFTEGSTACAAGVYGNMSITGKWNNRTITLNFVGDETGNIDIFANGYNVFPDPYNVIIPESVNTTPSGSGDLTSVDIPVPTPPTINICDTKFITLYSPTLAQLQALATYMWSESSFDISNFQKLFADPMECILGLIMLPFTVPTSGNSNIQVGNMPTNVSANNVSAQYFQLSCGSITIDRFTGSYLDFEPYTKAQIFLPYIGIQDLSVDDIMGKTISVTYNIDILTGACIAFIKCGGSVLYQFIGQCGANIPITSNTYTGVIQSLLDLTRSLTHVAGGDMVGGLSGVASASVNINKPKIQKSGTLSGVGGFLGIQYPYIILTKPNPAIPKDQNKYLGYPSYVTKQVGSCSGFTQFETVYLENMSCSETEKEQILNMLKEGVII